MLALSPRTKATFLALGIFVLGAVCGAMGERWFLHKQFRPFPSEGRRMGGPGRMNDRLLDRMKRHLSLTEEQQTAVAKILRESKDEIDDLRRKIGDTMRDRERNIQKKIMAELTPEQREKFEKSMRQIERKRSSRRWNDGGGPPPRGH